jgi:hypothetical protein
VFEYNDILLQQLINIGYQPQGLVGDIPQHWANTMNIAHQFELPDQQLTRHQVLQMCQDPNIDILKSYLCVMAWGGQGHGPGGPGPAQNAWDNQNLIQDRLLQIRNGNLSRIEAYNLFYGDNNIPGLGPAYFTKLLYFFCPGENMYIMDQWTTKAVLLLTGVNIIKHTGLGPSNTNTGNNYELFCRVIEELVPLIHANNGTEVEERLFSQGGRPRAAFRQLIYDLWPNIGLNRYNEGIVVQLLNDAG